MERPNQFRISPEDSDGAVLVAQYDSYIVAQAEQIVRQHADFAHATLLDLKIADLAQNVRIHLWQAAQRRPIRYPKAYIRQMVHNEFISLIRQQRRDPLALSTNEDGELCAGDILITPSAGMADPQIELEHKLDLAAFTNRAMKALLALPPRQRCAMLCSLLERVYDPIQFSQILKLHRVDATMANWPTDKAEAQLLKASLSPARQALAQRLNVAQSPYEQRRVTRSPQAD